MNKKSLSGLVLGALISLLGTSVHASLVGDTVTASFSVPSSDWSLDRNSNTVAVGGPEFQITIGGGRGITIDIEETYIDFTTANIGGETLPLLGSSYITISDMDWVGMNGSITSVTVTSFDDFLGGRGSMGTGPAASSATFTSNSITFRGGGVWNGTDRARVSFTTSHSVPEPGMLPLLVLGLVGVVVANKRRAR
ncbi:MAG: PEP-CTERM sorting domain-containing protein [Rhodoferax sp.]|nr:PEP-CTERM sorting domain-containing protein [Rhodoferax sp.]